MKKTEYHIVELHRGRGLRPQYYLWRTGRERGFLLPEVELYDTYEKAVEARDKQICNDYEQAV